jgi:PEP-CTERM/exosortase A-associated glycosyltransferase
MKILHVFDHSLPVQSGYAFRSAAILREQRKRGWKVVALTGPKHDPARASPHTMNDIVIHRTAQASKWYGVGSVGAQLEVIGVLRDELRRVIARESPDLLHAHSPCLNALAGLGLGIPLVYEMRSSWEDAAVSTGTTAEGSVRYRLSRALETFALRRADAVTVICDGLRADVLSRGVPADRIAVIPNAVDAESFIPDSSTAPEERSRLGLGDASVLGFVGSFFAWEGLDLLIEALPKVLARRGNVKVVLVGAGVHEPVLREAVARAGLHQHVLFLGQVPHAQVNALYRVIDVLVYPRRPMRLTDMVTPLKPLEAMALGKVQVASDVGGHRELIDDRRTGLLFRAGDADDLARAVLEILDDPQLAAALAHNGPRHVRENRTWAQSVQAYEPLYSRVLAAGHQ